ncbi:hypothetical protein B0H21DRAFT_781421 [Amylocystis lapponica]|nr:hypothetical protein B0H21DRAFT_781421 [Amylocystis lapponica]
MTHKGAAFEQRSLRLLEAHLSMSLRRVGGKDDGGVDLQGWWWLPSPPAAHRMRLRVLAQCKDEKRKPSPKYVRELEGVLYRYLARTQTPLTHADSVDSVDPVVGLLVSSTPYTKATLLRAHSSPMPLVLIHIPPASGPDSDAPEPDSALESADADTLGTLVFNPALGSSTGLLRGQILPRWERAVDAFPGSGIRGRPGLWCGGQRVDSWTPEGA